MKLQKRVANNPSSIILQTEKAYMHEKRNKGSYQVKHEKPPKLHGAIGPDMRIMYVNEKVTWFKHENEL